MYRELKKSDLYQNMPIMNIAELEFYQFNDHKINLEIPIEIVIEKLTFCDKFSDEYFSLLDYMAEKIKMKINSFTSSSELLDLYNLTPNEHSLKEEIRVKYILKSFEEIKKISDIYQAVEHIKNIDPNFNVAVFFCFQYIIKKLIKVNSLNSKKKFQILTGLSSFQEFYDVSNDIKNEMYRSEISLNFEYANPSEYRLVFNYLYWFHAENLLRENIKKSSAIGEIENCFKLSSPKTMHNSKIFSKWADLATNDLVECMTLYDVLPFDSKYKYVILKNLGFNVRNY